MKKLFITIAAVIMLASVFTSCVEKGQNKYCENCCEVKRDDDSYICNDMAVCQECMSELSGINIVD